MKNTFSDLGLKPDLVEALEALKINIPTAIQSEVIPKVLNGKQDIVALAQTGTGKTAAFGLPLLQLINSKESYIQAVILAPTRELGQQIYKNLESYAVQLPEIAIASVCGGIPIKPQIERLAKPTHIIVATPGRLVDLIKREAINIKNTSYFILDEADEMISALKDSVDEIIKQIPKTRRTLLFTATLSGPVKQLVQNYMSKQVLNIKTESRSAGQHAISHQYVVVEPIEKLEVLLYFLNSNLGQRGIIFCKTKAAVNKLAKKLAINKFSSGAIHGSLTQGIRNRIMDQFREGHIDILVATDLAARGIDVKAVAYVINYHLPDTYEAYTHRTGRTARAGAEGFSLTIIQKEEIEDIADFEAELDLTFKPYKKASAQSIEENNGLIWANKVFKTKPNRELSEAYKTKVKTIFHHLTKDELVEKILANYVASTKSKAPEVSNSNKKNKTS